LWAQDAAEILNLADSLSQAGQYTEAIALLEQHAAMFETGSVDDAWAWLRLGDYHSATGKYEGAKTYYLKSYDLLRPYAENEPEKYAYLHAVNLKNLSMIYSILSDYKAAIAVCMENIALVERYKEHFETADADLASLYGNISWCYLFTKEFALAEQAAQTALATDSTQIWVKTNLAHALLCQRKTSAAENIYKELAQTVNQNGKLFGQSLLDDFDALEKASIIPRSQKNKAKRIKTHIRSIRKMELKFEEFVRLALNEEKNGEALAYIRPYMYDLPPQLCIRIANVLGNLGTKLYRSGNYRQAETHLIEVKNIREKALGKEHANYGHSLNNLGTLYEAMGDYTKAATYHIEAKNIREKALGNEHPDYATSVNNLGALYHSIGHYSKAETYYTEAKNIKEKALGREHPDYAISVNNLGALCKDRGDYAKALTYYLEAKNIREKALGKEHPNYANSLNNLGSVYLAMGDYAKAETYYLEAKNIREKALGKEHPDYATSVNNLGALYNDMGDYAKAETYYIEAKNIHEKILGKEHPDYAISLNNLGYFYSNMGDYTKAETYYLEAKNIREKVLHNEHPDYAGSLNNLGNLYQAMGDYAKAEPYYLESKKIFEKAKHPYYAISLGNLGNLYHNMADYAKAETYLLEAQNIRKKTLENEHPYDAIFLNNLGLLYISKKDYPKASPLMSEALHIKKRQTERNFSFMSENQRTAFWQANGGSFNLIYSLTQCLTSTETTTDSYDNALFTKGLLLRTSNGVRDAIYSSGSAELVSQYEQLGSLRQRISNLQSKNEGNEDTRVLEARADSLDKVLTVASQAYRDLKADIAMTWQEVQQELAPDEAAVEFVHFKLYDGKWRDSTLYVAMVLRPGMQAPAWIPLCEEREITELLKIMQIPTNKDSIRVARFLNINGEQFYNLVWKPLEKELQGARTVYYSPSGLLHKIPFDALPVDTARLFDRYGLKLVSSSREIKRLKKEAPGYAAGDSAVIYGGILYDVSADSLKIAAAQYPRAQTRDFSGATRGKIWRYLSGSQKELENIKHLFDSHNILSRTFTGINGNEESFKHLGGTNTPVITVSTHGFFLDDIEHNDNREMMQHLGGRAKVVGNPLLRSGLLFAGANHIWTGKEPVEGIEDGTLTADEIAKLNLIHTKLVVLSACQTGLGEVKNSEGVFGLQRAFKLAGVETLIMSLWEVSDDATSLLMTAFYEQWLKGKSKQQAFRTAQRTVREYRNEQQEQPFASPYFWAAFVMMD
jgi:tetratricopeptide (TPR) repeat protein